MSLVSNSPGPKTRFRESGEGGGGGNYKKPCGRRSGGKNAGKIFFLRCPGREEAEGISGGEEWGGSISKGTRKNSGLQGGQRVRGGDVPETEKEKDGRKKSNGRGRAFWIQ